jgi:hypothetical protein
MVIASDHQRWRQELQTNGQVSGSENPSLWIAMSRRLLLSVALIWEAQAMASIALMLPTAMIAQ